MALTARRGRSHRPPPDQHGRGQRIGDDLDQPGTSAVSRRPASRTTTTRRSIRNGGVMQASTTAPTSSSSPGPPPISSTTNEWSRSPTTSASSVAHRLGHQRGVVALDQIRPRRSCAALTAGSCRSLGRHGPRSWPRSLTAASASRTRQVPLTSWTRTIRQPQEMPSAAAPREASPTLGDLQIEDDTEEGLVRGREQKRVAQPGQRRRGPQEGQGLLGRLAQIEPGVEHDALGGDAGRRAPARPDRTRKSPTSTTTSS